MQAARGASLSDADTPEPNPSGDRRRGIAILISVAAVVYVLDQVTKILAVRNLTGRDPVYLVDSVLDLRLVRNPGAAFGLAGGATIVFTLVAATVIVVILRTARKLRNVWWAVALGLLLGGALGNLTDRVFRAPGTLRGHVVDFIHVPHWPVFNVADSAIVCGAILMVLLSLSGRSFDGTSISARD
jgi:signal peptidase II